VDLAIFNHDLVDQEPDIGLAQDRVLSAEPIPEQAPKSTDDFRRD
jgi:hypothetical protein